jgi:hypothetical protein
MLNQYATPGAIVHSSTNGSAEDKASRRVVETSSATIPAMIGLAIISATNPSRTRRPPTMPAARAAVAAAVSHSRRRRLVIVSRTSVNAMACAVSQA